MLEHEYSENVCSVNVQVFLYARSTTCTTGEIALQGAITSLDYFPGKHEVIERSYDCYMVVFLDRHQLLCCSRENTLSLIDLRQNKITATFRLEV